jgi:hypothetical protein
VARETKTGRGILFASAAAGVCNSNRENAMKTLCGLIVLGMGLFVAGCSEEEQLDEARQDLQESREELGEEARDVREAELEVRQDELEVQQQRLEVEQQDLEDRDADGPRGR